MEKTSVGTAVDRTGVGVSSDGNSVEVTAGNDMLTVGAAVVGEGEHATQTLTINIYSDRYRNFFTVNLLFIQDGLGRCALLLPRQTTG